MSNKITELLIKVGQNEIEETVCTHRHFQYSRKTTETIKRRKQACLAWKRARNIKKAEAQLKFLKEDYENVCSKQTTVETKFRGGRLGTANKIME